MVGSVPLAFTQEDFLVANRFTNLGSVVDAFSTLENNFKKFQNGTSKNATLDIWTHFRATKLLSNHKGSLHLE